MRKPHKLAAVPILALAAWLARAASGPPVSLEASPPNPSAGQPVRLRDASAEGGSWLWDFGDGSPSESQVAPVHAWAAPGDYVVRLLKDGVSAETPVTVMPEDTLRLNPAHPFDIRVDATDRAGVVSAARAIAVTDRYGYFAFTAITGDPDNPEVTVKVLEAPAAGHYWIFWSAMTSLDYTLTVREVATGHVEVYRKDGPDACGGFDTQSFVFVPTPTPSGASPTPTPTTSPAVTPGTPAPGATRTHTRTPPATATPSATLTPTITATPTPTPPPFIKLRAIQWQWDFFSTDLGVNGGPEITLHVGQTYQVLVYNDDLPDVTDEHFFSGVSGVGLSGGPLPQGSSLPVQTITPMNAGDYGYLCTNYCGVGHDGMVGTIHVVP